MTPLTIQTVLEFFTFTLALWLGLYLVNRNFHNARLLLAGFGLGFYALALALAILLPFAPESTEVTIVSLQRPFLFLPAICWLLLLLHLWLRDDEPLSERLKRAKRPFLLILIASIFFLLGITTFVLVSEPFPRPFIFLGIGGDLLILGLGIAMLDAKEDGEAIWPDFIKSFVYTIAIVLLFAGQVGIVIASSQESSFPLIFLLFTTITVAVILQTTSNSFQSLLDKIVFAPSPEIQKEREQFRDVIDATQRLDTTSNLLSLDDKEFTRLTRRALSHMGNLPKLAASPLTRLPIIDARLTNRGLSENTLERAAELKRMLTESIERLKPSGNGGFDNSDAWRHYNALYYPYVLGLKPYRRRANYYDLNPSEKEAIEWFRAQVPERTLYNWQNAAAKLIAQDLREQSQ